MSVSFELIHEGQAYGPGLTILGVLLGAALIMVSRLLCHAGPQQTETATPCPCSGCKITSSMPMRSPFTT